VNPRPFLPAFLFRQHVVLYYIPRAVFLNTFFEKKCPEKSEMKSEKTREIEKNKEKIKETEIYFKFKKKSA